MASLDDLLSQIPIDQIAQQLGVDQATAESAVKTALPTLVGGLGANAQDPAGAASLESALQSHADTSLLDDGVDISKVDTADGQKIVSNIFGGNTDQVASALGGVGGGGGNDLVKQLLPILAPIVPGLPRQAVHRWRSRRADPGLRWRRTRGPPRRNSRRRRQFRRRQFRRRHRRSTRRYLGRIRGRRPRRPARRPPRRRQEVIRSTDSHCGDPVRGSPQCSVQSTVEDRNILSDKANATNSSAPTKALTPTQPPPAYARPARAPATDEPA